MAGSAPKVSILLPSFNARRFLEPRVDSLLKQTFSNWEAIVLDSHSTDGTWEFFEKIAQTDSRFRPYQVAREGLYAALNRGFELATGEFLCIAPCDDTMAPEFLAEMIDALIRCPEAGIAVCDCLFINQEGNELRAQDMAGRLPKREIKILLGSGTVPTFQREMRDQANYRPPPLDCLLHFAGRSVYFSLTQLLIRTATAKRVGFFETNVGSVADFNWLVRLTSLTGSVYLPKRLATWRFHGDQLSLVRDDSRLNTRNQTCEIVLRATREARPALLTERDCKLLLLPYKILGTNSRWQRLKYRLQGAGYVMPIFARNPPSILKTLYRTRMTTSFFIAVVLQRIKLNPKKLG